jgi:cell shape-determining protein MreC
LDEENLRLQERIKRLEEELIDVKNTHSVLVADVVLYEDKSERIKRLEAENDALRADLLLWVDTTDAMYSKAGIGFTTEDKP